MDVEQNPKKIEKSDISTEAPEKDGTVIVVQRHERYNRSEPNIGSLTEESAKAARELAHDTCLKMYQQLPAEERDLMDILVVASDTQYQGGGYRSMETAAEILDGAKEALNELGLSSTRILNESGKLKSTEAYGEKGPRPVPQIREPKIFTDSPEFVKFLVEATGEPVASPGFFAAYEEDRFKDKRIEMGAEGPLEMGDRLARFVQVLARFSKNYHERNPGNRLLVWVDSHYDTISPYIKNHIAGMDQNVFLPVDYGAGISINIDSSGAASTNINGREYSVLISPVVS